MIIGLKDSVWWVFRRNGTEDCGQQAEDSVRYVLMFKLLTGCTPATVVEHDAPRRRIQTFWARKLLTLIGCWAYYGFQFSSLKRQLRRHGEARSHASHIPSDIGLRRVGDLRFGFGMLWSSHSARGP